MRYCARCLTRARENVQRKRDENRAKGLCYCGKKLKDGRKLCRACTEYHRRKAKELYERRRESGACRRCGAVATVGRSCFKCWVKARAVNRLRKAALADMLLDKWTAQDGKCAYTRLPLTPGPSVEVDHLTPVSRGGGNSSENLVWTFATINLLKGERTVEEFMKDLPEIVKLLRRVRNPKGAN